MSHLDLPEPNAIYKVDFFHHNVVTTYGVRYRDLFERQVIARNRNSYVLIAGVWQENPDSNSVEVWNTHCRVPDPSINYAMRCPDSLQGGVPLAIVSGLNGHQLDYFATGLRGSYPESSQLHPIGHTSHYQLILHHLEQRVKHEFGVESDVNEA